MMNGPLQPSGGRRTILILGGYGNTGLKLATMLLEHGPNVDYILAGRSIEKTEKAAKNLNERFGSSGDGANDRVKGVSCDASNAEDLSRVFENNGNGLEMVVVASSTSQYVHLVVEAALLAKIDYFDIQLSAKKLAFLKSKAADIESAGCCFITDGGFHPGLPAALVRYVAPRFGRLESANVGSVMRQDWKNVNVGVETMEEFVAEFAEFQMLAYRDGEWRDQTWTMPSTMNFPRFGRQQCVAILLEEIKMIPNVYPDIRNTGFFVGSLNWFVDWFMTPVLMIGLKVWPKRAVNPLGRLLFWGLRTFSTPPFGTMLKLEARGTSQDGQDQAVDVSVYHEDGYELTAAVAAACLAQYLDDKKMRKPGLWLEGHIVEPVRLMKDLERMGVEVTVEANPVGK
jgi:hypothetical protein